MKWIWDWEKIWPHIASGIAVAMIVLAFLKEGFGIKEAFKSVWLWIYKNTVFHFRLPMRINKLESSIDAIKVMATETHYQLHPNGNGSLSDRTVRIEDRQKVVEANQEKQLEMLGKLMEMMEEHKRTITTLQNRLRVRDMVAEAMIMHIMPDGRCEFVNPFMLTLLGYNESDIMGISWEGLIHPQDLPGLQRTLQRAAQTADSFRYEVRVRDFHGNWYDGKFMAQAVKADNKLEKFYVVIHFIPDTDKR